MILGPLGTSLLRLEKFRYFETKISNDTSLLSGDWVLVEKTVYFQNQ